LACFESVAEQAVVAPAAKKSEFRWAIGDPAGLAIGNIWMDARSRADRTAHGELADVHGTGQPIVAFDIVGASAQSHPGFRRHNQQERSLENNNESELARLCDRRIRKGHGGQLRGNAAFRDGYPIILVQDRYCNEIEVSCEQIYDFMRQNTPIHAAFMGQKKKLLRQSLYSILLDIEPFSPDQLKISFGSLDASGT